MSQVLHYKFVLTSSANKQIEIQIERLDNSLTLIIKKKNVQRSQSQYQALLNTVPRI